MGSVNKNGENVQHVARSCDSHVQHVARSHDSLCSTWQGHVTVTCSTWARSHYSYVQHVARSCDSHVQHVARSHDSYVPMFSLSPSGGKKPKKSLQQEQSFEIAKALENRRPLRKTSTIEGAPH